MRTHPSFVNRTVRILSAFLFAGLIAIGVSVWFAVKINARTQLSARNEHAAELARQHLQSWIDHRLLLIRHIRDHASTLDDFNENAESIMTGFPGFLAINWIGPDYEIKSVLPAAPNAAALGKLVIDHPDQRVGEAIQRATYTSALQGTLVDNLFQGGTGYVTYLRVLDENANVYGYINSVFRLEQFEYVAHLGTPTDGDSLVAIHTRGESDSHAAEDGAPLVVAPIDLPDVELLLHVQPSPEALARLGTPIADLVLALYTLIAIILSVQFAVWLRRGYHLRESRQFSEGLAESIPQTAHVYNCNENRFEFFSGRLNSLLGDNHAERVRSESGFFLTLAHEFDRPKLSSMTQNAIDQPDGKVVESEIRLQHSDGTWRWFRTRNCVMTRRVDSAKTLVGTTEDITESKRVLEELGERVEYQRLFAKLSARFINAPIDTMNVELQRALQHLGAFVGVDRCIICEFNEGTKTIKSTVSWCKFAAEDSAVQLVGADLSEFEWSQRQIRQHGYSAIESVADLPPEAELERALYEAQNVKSAINLPIITQGKLTGYLGLECLNQLRHWEPALTEQLLTVGQVLGNAIDRRNTGESLQYRIDLENIITHISTEFVNIAPNELDIAFGDALEKLGEFANVDRACLTVFANRQYRPSHAFEWCCDDEDSFLAEALERPVDDLKWATELFLEGKNIEVTDRDELPPEAASMRKIMENKRMHGLLAVPLTLRGHLIGYLGFDVRTRGHRWPKDTAQLLRIVGEVFVSAIDRARADAKRLELEKQILHTQKLEGLGVLAGGIAHDFNNLLVGILGSADLALAELPADSPIRDHIAQVLDASKRASDLTQQMLAYSGRGAFVLRQVDLNDVVRDTMPLVKASISKNTRIRFELTDDLPPIDADPTQMHQIAMNLFINASEALNDRPGDVIVRTGVELREQSPGEASAPGKTIEPTEYVYLEVADTGVGMDAETRERIFDPFFSTKFTGRGLGLAAVTGIVKGHNGFITVKSDLNEGSVFRVRIPSTRSSEEVHPPATATSTGDEPWTVEGAILVVDDEPAVRNFVRRALEHHGFDVITADGGAQATELFEEHWEKICAVVLDMTMPDMGGFEVYQTLQRIDANVQVLLSSGYSEQDATSQFEPENLAGFIQKPFTTSDLLDSLRESIPDIRPKSQRSSGK